MPADPIALSSLEERIQLLRDELSQALRWDRPSLLLAVHRSELVRAQVEAQLTVGLQVDPSPYIVDRTNADIPLEIRGDPDRAHKFYLVRGLRWGGGGGHSNAYRALNMHREFLVEDRVRLLLWLTPFEARQLPRFAPDFWAFRHRYAEFLDLPEGGAQILDGLAGLPRSAQALTRLAEAYLRLQCHEDAIRAYRQAARLGGDRRAGREAVAQVYQAMGRGEQARRLLRAAAGETRPG
jgi:tetratricopeptide (TPR) repeat protein